MSAKAITVHCNLNDSDHRAFQRHALFRYHKVHLWLAAILVVTFLPIWRATAAQPVNERLPTILSFLLTLLGYMVLAVLLICTVRRSKGFQNGQRGKHAFEISDDYITELTPNGHIQSYLAAIRSVDETSLHFFVITTAVSGYIIPKRDLPSSHALLALKSKITEAESRQ